MLAKLHLEDLGTLGMPCFLLNHILCATHIYVALGSLVVGDTACGRGLKVDDL